MCYIIKTKYHVADVDDRGEQACIVRGDDGERFYVPLCLRINQNKYKVLVKLINVVL